MSGFGFEERKELVSLIEAKNAAHARMLQSWSRMYWLEFRRSQRRVVKKAVNRATEEWVCRITMEGEAAVKDNRTR